MFVLSIQMGMTSKLAGNLLNLLRSGIDNWTDFKASNNIQGWDNSTVCTWTGIVCNAQGLVAEM